VLLNDEDRLPVPLGGAAGRLRRFPKVTLGLVFSESHGGVLLLHLDLGRSRRHSRGRLSVRSPSKRGWRSSPFCVHSPKAISATSCGRTQWTWSPRGGSPSSKGDVERPSASRRSRRSRRVSRV